MSQGYESPLSNGPAVGRVTSRTALRTLWHLGAGLLSCAVFGIAGAQTLIRVPQDYPTIQAAINASANGNTVLVAAGMCVENINFMGTGIAVKSESGPNVTVIYGNAANPVVTFARKETASSELTGFTIRNGYGGSASGYLGSCANMTLIP